MIRPLRFFLILILGVMASAPPVQAQSSDEEAILEAIKTFFDGFAAQDSTQMWSVTERGARLVMTSSSDDGSPMMRSVTMTQFMDFVVNHEGEPMVETYWDPQIRVEDNLATVWIRYNFYVGETLDHCGEDTFQLFRSAEGWTIIAVADTQRRAGCEARE